MDAELLVAAALALALVDDPVEDPEPVAVAEPEDPVAEPVLVAVPVESEPLEYSAGPGMS